MVALPFTHRITPRDMERIDASGDADLRSWVQTALSHPYYTFEPREDQPAVFDQQTSFVEDRESKFAICLGGTGSGKTVAAAFKTARYVLETKPMRPSLPFWIIGEVMDQVCNVCWVEKLSQLIPPSQILGYVWYLSKRNWPRSVLLRHPDDPTRAGWILEFKSYEQGIGAMKGESIGGYWCNEEIPYHLISEIQGRCRDYNSPGWADFTPVECKDAEWPEAYEQWQAGSGKKGWTFYHLNNLFNDAVPPGSEQSVAQWARDYLENIPEDLRAMRSTGHFTVLAGAVYKEFSKRLHVVEPFRIPRDWPKWRAIDFGYNNPFCCLWLTRDRDGTIIVYDEHYEAQRLLSHHVKAINGELQASPGLNPRREWDETEPWYRGSHADHDSQDCAELAAMGLSTIPAYKAIHHGIEMVRSRMLPQGDKQKPRLQIFSNCKNLIREIPGYKWMSGTDKRSPQDLPYDVDNHALDCLRYGVAAEDLASRFKGVTGRRVVKDARRHGVLLEKRA